MAGIWMIHSAAAIGDVKRVEALINAGIDANAIEESGVCVLEKACQGGHAEVVAALLKRGARASGVETSSSTPLHRAMSIGTRGCRLVQMLCEHGADRKRKDAAGRTPADFAREMGLKPLPELL